MVRQEKLMQEPIHLQQPVAIQKNLVAFNAQKTPVLQALNCLAKSLRQLDAEFLFEVSAADVTKLQLQNRFTNQSFILARCQRPPDWQLTLVNARNVRVEVVLILIMRPVYVSERSHSGGQQIRSFP